MVKLNMETSMKNYLRRIGVTLLILLAGSLMLLSGGCQLTDAIRPTPDVTEFFAQALLTATYAVPSPTLSPTPVPATATPVPTETPTLGPTPELPVAFTYANLEKGSIPQQYIEDTCEVLYDKLNPENALPGTVVMPIMFHSVTGNDAVLEADGTQINDSMLSDLMTKAKSLGFETVTMQEMVDFMEHNARIPQRSMLIIVDDRRPGVFRSNFYPYLVENNWTISLAWPIGDTDIKPASDIYDHPEDTFNSLWEQMEAYYRTGYLDVQSHGYVHNIPISVDSTDEFIRHEMVDSRAILQEHFYCKDAQGQPIADCQTAQPLAYIWPGGGFTQPAVAIAREAGYHLGFTTQPRGPVMFNWVPLAAEKDPNREFWMPEIPMDDPLMTLPRYWSLDAVSHLEEVAAIGDAAAAYENETRAKNIAYYQYFCQDTFGILALE
jgi:hypothetical protein